MNQIVHEYIGRLYDDLADLRFSIDPTIEASHFRERSDKGIRYGVKVSLLRDKANAEWSVFDAYRIPYSSYTRLSRNARKYFSLTHEGNRQLKEVAVSFAREMKADITSDFPVLIGITSSEPLNERNPRSTFVEDVSKYATALIQAAQQPILTPPTPKPTSIPTPSPTPPVNHISSRPLYQNPRSRLMGYSIFMDPAYREAWALWERFGRDWKEIPEAALRRNGYTRRITGASSSRITVEIIPLLEKNDES